jgi:very-short-patch-repair endonuclease
MCCAPGTYCGGRPGRSLNSQFGVLFRYKVPRNYAWVARERQFSFARRNQIALNRLAARQEGVVRWDQLIAIGFTRAMISRWVALGRLFRIHRGVYAVGRRELSRDGRFLAAVWSVGTDAALTGFAAAALWGFWKGHIDPIEVVVGRRVRPQPGVVVRRNNRASVTTRHGIPVTTPEQTILYLAEAMYSDRHFRRLVHEGQVQKVTSLSALLAEVARAPKRTQAVERVERELADGAKPTRSYLEDDLVELLRAGGFPPFETNAHVPGTPPWVEVDVWFPRQRLAVEIDGPHHDTAYRREFDAYKGGVVESAKAGVLRLGEEAVTPAHKGQTASLIHGRLQACK